METVAFISTENGDDLIVSFAVIDSAHPTEIDSLTLLRTPKYEHLLGDSERGISVSFERYVEDDDELLEELHLDGKSAVVRLTTSCGTMSWIFERSTRKKSRLCKTYSCG